MSVVESFLRGGKPGLGAAETLSKTLTTAYAHWCWVVVFPRQWRHDDRVNAITAPSFHLLFGFNSTTGDADEGDATVLGGEIRDSLVGFSSSSCGNWHLLFATVQSDGRNNSDTVATVRDVFAHVPAHLHPASVSVAVCATGDTHERLGLCGVETTSWVAERIAEKLLDPLHALVPSAGHVLFTESVKSFTAAYMRLDKEGGGTRWCKAFHKSEQGDGERAEAGGFGNEGEDTAAFRSLVGRASEWVRLSSGLEGTADASLPPQGGQNEELLRASTACHPLLWRTRFIREETARRAVLSSGSERREGGVDAGDLSGVAKLKAERDAERDAWRAAIGEYTSFALPNRQEAEKDAEGAESDQLDFRYVLLLQRPHSEKRAVDMDNRDPGPLAPQPIGAEVHLLPDPGDVLHVVHQLSGEAGAVSFTYEDYLDSEGEVLLQLGPVEGVAFEDLDRLITLLDKEGVVQTAGPPLCEGSCSCLAFPRVVFRRPTGKSEKVNPVARSHAQVAVASPTPRMLRRATEALRMMSDHICDLSTYAQQQQQQAPAEASLTPSAKTGAVGKPGYTLVNLPPIDDSVLGPPSRRCGWCMRRRERLLRCGACKAVYYCSKAHQATDWKEGTHKKDCGVFRKGTACEESVFAPLREKMDDDERMARTGGWSCAGVVEGFLRAYGLFFRSFPPGEPSLSELHVHVVGVEPGWVADMAGRLAQLLCTCAPQEQGSRGPQLRLSVFVEELGTANAEPRTRRLCEGEEGFANNTILALQGNAGDAAAFVEVPATGVVGDVWHVHGAGDDRGATAPVLLRVCNTSYFRYVEGDGAGSSSARLRDLKALVYVGPKSGEGLGYLYGSLDTVARLVVGSVPLRFVDSTYMGSYRTAGALLARLDERTDAGGVAVRDRLDSQWKATAAVPKKAAEAAALTDELVCLNTECFAVLTIEKEPAPYVNGFYFDVPPSPSPQ